MDKMIGEIYKNMIQGTNYMDEINQEIQTKIADLLREEQKRMGWKEYEEYRDRAFLIALIAEEGGFIKGFKYAVRLMSECFIKKNTTAEP